MNIIEVLEPWLADAISIRHAIHKQPELGFEENNNINFDNINFE